MQVKETPLGYIVEGDGIDLYITNIVHIPNEGIYATVYTTVKIPEPETLSITRVNLLSYQSIKNFAKIVEDWLSEETVRKILTTVLECYLSPPQPRQLHLVDEATPSWLIEGFLLQEAQNIIFAPGGTGKSFLALFLALCVHNELDLIGPTKRAKTLYLDWETDEAEMNRRLTLLVRGMSEVIGEVDYPFYLRMHSTLTDSLNYILEVCTKYGYRFVIVDSAACAIGGDVNNTEEVVRFFSAIRRINACGITTLIVSHVSKAARKDNNPSPIGSVFFENFPRLAWELKSEWDADKSRYLMSLICRKSNVGKVDPIGLEFVFGPWGISVARIEPDVVEVVRDNLAREILALLATGRAMTAKEIAEELQVKPGSVWVTLHRLKTQGRVTNTYRGVWKVRCEEEEGFPGS